MRKIVSIYHKNNSTSDNNIITSTITDIHTKEPEINYLFLDGVKFRVMITLQVMYQDIVDLNIDVIDYNKLCQMISRLEG